MSSLMIQEILKIPKTMVLNKDLKKRKFFPHALVREQMGNQIQSCKELLIILDFKNKMITTSKLGILS